MIFFMGQQQNPLEDGNDSKRWHSRRSGQCVQRIRQLIDAAEEWQ